MLNSALKVAGELTLAGTKQLKECSEVSSIRQYRWLNQEAVGEEINGFWGEIKKCRWSLSMLFGEGLHAGTVAGRDVAGSHCVPQSS